MKGMSHKWKQMNGERRSGKARVIRWATMTVKATETGQRRNHEEESRLNIFEKKRVAVLLVLTN